MYPGEPLGDEMQRGLAIAELLERSDRCDDVVAVGAGLAVTLAHVMQLLLDLMALARPRSTLLRCGALLHTAVWDAGYQGRSEALLVVANPHGLRLERGARICQMIFLTLDAAGAAYRGAYQGENV